MSRQTRLNQKCFRLFAALERSAGRNAPIERREVRLAGSIIITAPIGGYELVEVENVWFPFLSDDPTDLAPRPIMGLWHPLLDELTKDNIERISRLDPNRPRKRFEAALDMHTRGLDDPCFIGPPAPAVEPPVLRFGDEIRQCEGCGQDFFVVPCRNPFFAFAGVGDGRGLSGHHRYCGDDCAAKGGRYETPSWRNAAHNAERSKTRLAARANRECEHCDERIHPRAIDGTILLGALSRRRASGERDIGRGGGASAHCLRPRARWRAFRLAPPFLQPARSAKAPMGSLAAWGSPFRPRRSRH